MLRLSTKPRRCKECPDTFVPSFRYRVCCSDTCNAARALRKLEEGRKRADRKAVAERKAERAARKREKAEWKLKNRGRKEWVQVAQKAFNAYIRARDFGRLCICCNKPPEPMKPGGSIDAGHFLPVSTHGQHRFNENNVFAQRKNCNRPGGTTYDKFRAGVVARIGEAAVAALEQDRNPHTWTIPELQAIESEYKAKLKGLERLEAA